MKMNVIAAVIAIVGSAATIAFGRKSWQILKGEKKNDSRK
jgi:hypothetical protein